MVWLDWVLIIALLSYAWGGSLTGLIQSIGGLVGLLLAVVLTPRLAGPVGDFLSVLFGGNHVLGEIFAFILLFLLITRLVALIFVFGNRAFNLVAILPGMKSLNRLGGALFGLLEGSLFLGILLQYITRLPLSSGLTSVIQDSVLAPTLMGIAVWLVALFPKALRETTRVIDKVVPN